MTTKETTNKITLSGGVITIKDHPISDEKALKIVTIVMGPEIGYDRLSEGHQSSQMQLDVGNTNTQGNAQHPKAFMAQKKPSSEVERITCLAYYLTHNRSTPVFKTRELTKLNTEAAQQQFSNSTIFARNAVNAGYLALAGGGNKQITALGEAVVQALPDREKIKVALEEYKSNRKRRPKKNSKRKMEE